MKTVEFSQYPFKAEMQLRTSMVNALNNDTVCMVTGEFGMKVKVFWPGTETEGVSLVMKARRK